MSMIRIDNIDLQYKPESIYNTPVYKIGKTMWYMSVYKHHLYGKCTRYLYQKSSGYWAEDKDHPRYNSQNGETMGLPKSLRRIWEIHRHDIDAVLHDKKPCSQTQSELLFQS